MSSVRLCHPVSMDFQKIKTPLALAVYQLSFVGSVSTFNIEFAGAPIPFVECHRSYIVTFNIVNVNCGRAFRGRSMVLAYRY